MNHILLYGYIVEKNVNWNRYFTSGQVRRELNMPKTTFNRYMKQLIELDLVIRVKRGKYEICIPEWWITIGKYMKNNPRLSGEW